MATVVTGAAAVAGDDIATVAPGFCAETTTHESEKHHEAPCSGHSLCPSEILIHYIASSFLFHPFFLFSYSFLVLLSHLSFLDQQNLFPIINTMFSFASFNMFHSSTWLLLLILNYNLVWFG